MIILSSEAEKRLLIRAEVRHNRCSDFNPKIFTAANEGILLDTAKEALT